MVYTTSMKSEFLNVEIKSSTKFLSPAELKQMRECGSHVRRVFSDRLNTKYDAVNSKYSDLASEEIL